MISAGNRGFDVLSAAFESADLSATWHGAELRVRYEDGELTAELRRCGDLWWLRLELAGEWFAFSTADEIVCHFRQVLGLQACPW
jgi:hypothetical protein